MVVEQVIGHYSCINENGLCAVVVGEIAQCDYDGFAGHGSIVEYHCIMSGVVRVCYASCAGQSVVES